MRSYRKSLHTVHDHKVHVIWITKYRYEILTKEVGYRIRELIRQVYEQNNIQIIRITQIIRMTVSLPNDFES
jgi:putative transposase